MRNLLAVLTVAAMLAGCNGIGPRPEYDPVLDPRMFVEGIDNPWLPLVPGATWVYEKEGERIEVEVLQETRMIMGVEATVVRDTEYENGVLLEDTWDWFAQDVHGNVWYLGEDTCEYEDDVCVNTEGAWEWGVDGALPGVVMWADPQPGEPYFQEFYWPTAIDEAQVLERGVTITTGLGTFTDALKTKEWTRVSPGHEIAYYVQGIGVVQKGHPGEAQETLVAYNIPDA